MQADGRDAEPTQEQGVVGCLPDNFQENGEWGEGEDYSSEVEGDVDECMANGTDDSFDDGLYS
jgi:hypothetical protein